MPVFMERLLLILFRAVRPQIQFFVKQARIVYLAKGPTMQLLAAWAMIRFMGTLAMATLLDKTLH